MDKNSEKQTVYNQEIIYTKFIFFLVTHIFAIYGLYITMISQYRNRLLFEIILLYQISGLGVTAGLHRLWSHRSYKASVLLKCTLWIFVCICNQGSIFHWVRDHRVHHKYSDTDADPHNINRGFFFAHIGWLFHKKHQAFLDKSKLIPVNDLLNDFIVVLDKKLHPYSHMFISWICPGIYTYYMYNNVLLGVLVHGFLRWIITLHATWCINSVAHLYGTRPYSNIKPVQNIWTSILALGEGWHNYHHTYPYDYATSEYGFFENYNPTKLFIELSELFGLAYDLKRANLESVEKDKIKMCENQFKE